MACSNLENSFCNLLTKLEQTTRKVFGFGSSQRTKPVLTSFSGKLRRGEHRPGTYSSLFGFALERKYQLLRREILLLNDTQSLWTPTTWNKPEKLEQTLRMGRDRAENIFRKKYEQCSENDSDQNDLSGKRFNHSWMWSKQHPVNSWSERKLTLGLFTAEAIGWSGVNSKTGFVDPSVWV